LLRPVGHSPRWFTQPANPKFFQSRVIAEIGDTEVQDIAFMLSHVCDAFEITQMSSEPSLFVFEARLGLKHMSLDQAGEPVLRVGHIQQLIDQSGGSMRELERLLRLSSAQAWFDLLEPLRAGKMPLEGLRRVG
jgi:hypothetical protein